MEASLESNRNSIDHMRDAVIFDGPQRGRKLSRFWILLTLASVIAAAGVVADSTATVIGAMIVAPMMLPIQGSMLATVLGDRENLIRSVVLVIAGAVAAIGIGYAVGLFSVNDIVAATNAQVAGRVHPHLIDLLAALATGVVGSIALVRRDISDTLPGVAIAISLVPPLSVVGLTLESGAYTEALGALLLFVTNVAAILATGTVVMGIYNVHKLPAVTGRLDGRSVNRRNAVLVIGAMMLVVGIPLTLSTISSSVSAVLESTVSTHAQSWADDGGWELLSVTTGPDGVTVRVAGPEPAPDTGELAAQLDEAGVDPSRITVELVPAYTVELGGE